MRIKQKFLPPSLLFLFAALSPAATLVYHVELGMPTTTSGAGHFTGATNTTLLPVGPFPKLNGTLNPADHFQFVFSAPSRFLFSLLPLPQGGKFPGFSAITQQVFPRSEFFADASAAEPIPNDQRFTSVASGDFAATIQFPHSPLTFKSLTATFAVPEPSSMLSMSAALTLLGATNRKVHQALRRFVTKKD